MSLFDDMHPLDRLAVEHMAEASMRALDLPGGAEILERMADGQMPVADGMAALLIMSGEYERR